MEAVYDTLNYFQKGGLVMWPLLLCSIMVITVAIERFLFYKAVDSGNCFAEEYCKLLSDGDMKQALILIEQAPGKCAEILRKAQHTYGNNEYMSLFFENQANIFIAKLRCRLDYLSIIVTLSPLLGLLGTIVGMIGAFSIFNLDVGAPLAITGGIGEALIATATGLCVAILALCVHSYFAHRMERMITNMEQCFSACLEAEKRGVQ